jgi:rare lipoprotein A
MVVLGLVGAGSCARPSGYHGYQTRSYSVRGHTYFPMGVEEALSYEEVGVASWYDESKFLGLKRGTTSLGEKVLPWHLIGAHKTLPLPCEVRVTNLENGNDVRLRINDRGPFIPGRLLDVSPRAAKKLGFRDSGLTRVKVEVLSVGDGSLKRKKPKHFIFF